MNEKMLVTTLILAITMNGCHKLVEIPDASLSLTFDTLREDLKVVVAVIAAGNFDRVYNEVFSDSLKDQIDPQVFADNMKTLKTKYGNLLVNLSYGTSMHWTEDPFLVEIDYLMEYEKRTIFAIFRFTGSPDNLKLSYYKILEW